MFTPRRLLFLLLLIATLSWLSSSGFWEKNKFRIIGYTSSSLEPDHALLRKLRLKADEAALFIKKNNFNSSICFLLDMSLPSGQPRFFVYDFKADSLQNSGVVTHGRCNENWLEGRKYGNTIGGGCTSLGKYKIGYSYNGKFGLAFKLHGLEKTNDNAFARFVVLHAHDCVPETGVTDEICQSDGCPTVAPGFLQQLKPMIKNSGKPILLWIYE